MEDLDSVSQAMVRHRKGCIEAATKNQGKILTDPTDFKHGDIVRVISHEKKLWH